jgi:hypothetical protein
LSASGATLSYTSANAANTSGTLTVSNGGTSATIDMVGHYTASSFKIGHDGGGHVEITDPAATIASGAITTLAGSANASNPGGPWSLLNSTDSKLALLNNYIAGSFGTAANLNTETPLIAAQQPANELWSLAKPHI